MDKGIWIKESELMCNSQGLDSKLSGSISQSVFHGTLTLKSDDLGRKYSMVKRL